MLTITIYGEEFQCDRVEKGANFIKVYLDGKLILENSGIIDFSGYNLVDENGNPATYDNVQ